MSGGVEVGATAAAGPLRAEATLGLAARNDLGAARRVDRADLAAIPSVGGQLDLAVGRLPLAVGVRLDYELATTLYPLVEDNPTLGYLTQLVQTDPLVIAGAVTLVPERRR